MVLPRRRTCLLLAALAVGTRAEDPPRPPVRPAPPDAIAAARRDFDTIKGARGPAESPRLSLPMATPPPLHLSSEESALFLPPTADPRADPRSKGSAAAKGAKSANWLVDAMTEKRPDARNERRAGEGGRETTATEPETETDPLEAPAVESKKEPLGPKPSVSADNPLTSYMAGWMTPKDFELLKVRTAETNFNAAPDREAERASDPAGLEGLLRGEASMGGGGRAGTAVPPVATRATNPYLADLGSMGGPAGPNERTGLLVAGGPADGPAPLLAPTPKVETAPVKTDPPPDDRLKPTDDAKYFRQLKRF